MIFLKKIILIFLLLSFVSNCYALSGDFIAVDVESGRVLEGNNIHKKRLIASTTKIMTCLVVLENFDLDKYIVVGDEVNRMYGTNIYLSVGEKIKVVDLLYGLMLRSGNDAAIAIAEGMSGTVEEFAVLMNKEANLCGATHSHFVNANGLHNEDHYTTVYDMYLITNEAIHYPAFLDIIQLKEFSATITDKNGAEKEVSVKTSNKFHDGTFDAPESITVIGGKTGTTSAAGSCLSLVTRDSKGNPYIAVILHASERSVLYEEMIKLLEEINSR